MCSGCHSERGAAPQLILEDELGRCLCFLDVEPAAYPRAARQWAARLLFELPLSLEDAQLLLGALHELACEEAPRRGEPLVELLERHGLSRAARILREWLATPTAAAPLIGP